MKSSPDPVDLFNEIEAMVAALQERTAGLWDSYLKLDAFLTARDKSLMAIETIDELMPIRNELLKGQLAGVELQNYGRNVLIRVRQSVTNATLNARFRARYDADDYKLKRDVVTSLNESLRLNQVAIARPSSDDPCILLAVSSRDGMGRYTLEDRGTKKRAGSYKSIVDMLPVKLVPDIPRKEGIIERRKKRADDKEATQQKQGEQE